MDDTRIIEELSEIKASLEEIKKLLVDLVEPPSYVQLRLQEIARQFAQGNKEPLKQWNREQRDKMKRKKVG